MWVNEATDGKSKSYFSGPFSSSNTDSKYLVHLCENSVQKDITGFVYFSQFFISMLLLESQNAFIGMQNLDEGADSTFQGLCAKIFQSCKEKCKHPQLSVSFPCSHQQVADNAHFIHISTFPSTLLQLRTFKVFYNKWNLTVLVYFSNNHKMFFFCKYNKCYPRAIWSNQY